MLLRRDAEVKPFEESIVDSLKGFVWWSQVYVHNMLGFVGERNLDE